MSVLYAVINNLPGCTGTSPLAAVYSTLTAAKKHNIFYSGYFTLETITLQTDADIDKKISDAAKEAENVRKAKELNSARGRMWTLKQDMARSVAEFARLEKLMESCEEEPDT